MKRFLQILVLVAAMALPFGSMAQTLTTVWSQDFDQSTSFPSEMTKKQGLVDQVLAGSASLTGTGNWSIKSASTAQGFASNHAFNNVFGTSRKDWMISPAISLGGTNPQLGFDLALTAYSGNGAAATNGTDDRFAVLVSTDNMATWTLLREWNNSGSTDVYNNIATAGEAITIDLASYAGQTINIAFYVESTVSNADNNLHVDNIAVTEMVSCVRPSAIAMGPVGTTAATLSWTPAGSESTWKVVLSDATGVVDSVMATATTHTFTGLTSNTPYSVSVYAVCGADDMSGAVVASFRTECELFALSESNPFVEDFENGMSPCYQLSRIEGTGSSDWNAFSSATYAHSGTSSARIADQAATTRHLMVLQKMAKASNEVYQLSFWAYQLASSSYGAKILEGVRAWYNTTPDTVGGTVLAYHHRNVDLGAAAGNIQYEALIPNTADTFYIIFEGINEYGGASYIDDIEISLAPTCPKPRDLAVTAVGSSTADLTWTAGAAETSWQMQYKASADTVWTMVSDIITTTSYTLTGLNGNSPYQVEIRAYCSADDQSAWSSPVSLRTECVEMVLPYNNNFDDELAGSSSASNQNFVFCWNRLKYNPGSDAYNYPYVATSVGVNGSKGLYFTQGSTTSAYYSDAQVAVLPQVNTDVYTISGLRLSANYKRSSGTTMMVVGVMSDPNDYTTFVGIDTIAPTGSDWMLHTTYFTNYTGDGSYIAICQPRTGTSNTVYVDDVTLEELPSCIEPTVPVVSGVTSNSATLTWTLGPGASQTPWQLQYKLSSDSEWTLVDGITDNTYTLTQLQHSSNYNVQVRAYCAADDQSQWVSASFATECGVNDMPWSENFAGGISRCWTKATGLVDGVLDGTVVLNTTTSGWGTISDNGIQGPHVKMNVFGVNAKYWLITPQVAIDGNAILSFDAALTDYGNANVIENFGNVADDRFVVLMTTDDSTWTVLREWNGDTANEYQYAYIPTTGANYSIEINDLQNATVRFAFYGESTVTGGDNDLHIGNILVEAAAVPAQSYVFDFEDAADNAEWTMTTATNSWYIGIAANNGGNNGLYISNDEGVTNAYTNNSTVNAAYAYRTITIEDVEYSYSYNWRCSAESNWDFLRVALIPADQELDNSSSRYTSSLPTGWIAIDGGSQRVGQSSWQTQEGTFRVPAGEYKLAFYWRNDSGGGTNPPAAVDNIVITPLTCPAPVALAAGNVAAHSADVAWTAGGSESSWLVRVINNGAVVDSAVVNDTTYAITGLDAATTYTVEVEALCSAEDNSYAVATSFTTACDAETLPYYASYSNFGTCWNLYSGLLSDVMAGTATLNNTFSGWSTNTSVWDETHYKANIYGSSHKYWMVTPVINLSADAQLEFDAAFTAYGNTNAPSSVGDDDRFVVLATTNNGGTWTILRSFGADTADDAALTSISNTGSSFVIPLTQFTGENVRIAFYSESMVDNADNDIHVHNIIVEQLASCARPAAITVAATTSNSASFTWTAGDAETAWEIQYKEASDTAWTLVSGISATNYTLTGLQAATSYEAQVRAACSATDFSNWTPYVAFNTDLCAPEDQCTISVTMHDQYDDSWNNGSLDLVDSLTGITVHTFVLDDGQDGLIETANVCSGRIYQLVWNAGWFDDECSFSVADANGNTIYTGLYPTAGVMASFEGCGAVVPPTIDTVAMTMASLEVENYYSGMSFIMVDSAETNMFIYEFDGSVVSGTVYTLDDMDVAGYVNYITSAQAMASDATFQMIVNGADTTINATMLVGNTYYVLTYTHVGGPVVADSINVTVLAADAAMGTATGSGRYEVGETFAISAVANDGYYFVAWNDQDTNATRTIVADTADMTFIATFAAVPVIVPDSINVTVLAADTAMGTVTGSGRYEVGETFTISAVANNGYYFVAWNDQDTNATRTIVADTADMTFTATFAAVPVIVPDSINVTVLAADAAMGTVTGSGRYEVGETFTIAAIANDGYHFVAWNDQDTNATRTIVADTMDMTFTATFAINSVVVPDSATITVVVADTTMGTVTGSGRYEVGETITITAVANNGFHFVSWNDGNTEATRQIVVEGDATYTATFEADQVEGIDDVMGNITIATRGNEIVIKGAENQSLVIFDVQGRIVVRENSISATAYPMSTTGVYLVKVGNYPAKKVVIVR